MAGNLINILNEVVEEIVEYSRLEDSTRRAVEALEVRNAHIIAFGKGAISMARGALEALSRVEGGLVIVPEYMEGRVDGLETLKSTHPLPSEKSLKAGEAVLEYADSLGRDDNVLVLVSGGGSALVESPLEGLSLEDIIEANRILLNSGMSILEINTVRKHLSRIKGGRLAEALYPARTYGLYASDVPGDRLDLIASGPTVPDPSTYHDAVSIIKTYNVENQLPRAVLGILEKGARGELPETPKPGDKIFENVVNKLTAANIDVLKRLEDSLKRRGYNTLVLTSRVSGESRDVAKVLASIALESYMRGVPIPGPAAIIIGGETSVTVRGSGRGGRNMELALWFAREIDYWMGDELEDAVIGIVSMDTDGIDGITDAAGAIAYNGLLRRARKLGIDYDGLLGSNDSYRLAGELGVLVKTGPTGSNLNSVSVVLVGVPGE
ncbi:MAG: glycerate kinase [Desulfurococcales archaeon]|nr:glycerate kinase [Desulfurococcales archaeon]